MNIIAEYEEVTTGPSAVIRGATIYAGNIYLYIPGIEIEKVTSRSTLLKTYKVKYRSDVILTMASTDLKSVRFDGTMAGYDRYPLNYGDFIRPHPWR